MAPVRKWSAKELRLLRKRPDRELAKRFGRSLQAIATKRCLLGIPRVVGPGENRPWTGEEEAVLGSAPDNEIGQRLKRTAVSVTKRRQALNIPHFWDRPWTDAEDRKLGTST